MSETESRIRIELGDITTLEVDAVVTAANSALRGGGGVDGAVHNAAGPGLVEASMAVAPCPAGCARITDAFNLKSRFVIHAVGPIFSDLDTDSPLLESAYRAALEFCPGHQINSIAFPCISTGIFGFPHHQACEIAITTVVRWLNDNKYPQQAVFCCFESDDFDRYTKRLEGMDWEL